MQFSSVVALVSIVSLTRAAVSQIGDGQVQAATAASTVAAVSQITDGQIQATTAAAQNTVAAVSQITDGQIQATKGNATVSVQTENGAARLAVGAGAAAFAAYLL
ncbi:hypothetical protein TPHA_0G03240 [Tetrapisispora phaffii CBS 4417]|uniref:Uncharacterized protein n=1 Tax=Tetrapisispora phaffii (strain ATCC 24235 / CBS 4417 / NBRC 1672 / NRRL Y-8282 / UCD 70-5) TaxID=1071381 RepID=G8BW86_TETPH|nr:hypothetical protein TPHA_0G03240 [Tetrapisispora phaffii CBS 4417]CCE64164.1 hypothetical protein TPHA_0G03240 [Tetrapisispora phaffii CBS 4417]